MTNEQGPRAENPHELLSAVHDLTRRVRVAQRGTWFPLAVLGVITLAVIPVYRYAPRHLGPCRSGPGGTSVCAAYIPGVLVYWPVALLLAYAVIAGFYLSHAHRRGVGTRIRPYIVAGVAIAILLTAVTLWRAAHPPLPLSGIPLHAAPAPPLVGRLGSATVAIGLALLVLAWVERNWWLTAYSLVYLVIVVAESARVSHSPSPWGFLSHLLIPAAMLLLGSAGFALFQPAAKVREQ
jgi:hypothetical protein